MAASSLTPEQRTQRATIAAHESWANTKDRRARTRAAAEASHGLGRFIHQVDPEGRHAAILAAAEGRDLTVGERAEVRSIEQRAESARKAHFARLAFRSAKARRARKQAS